nr:MAG TPA: hypothetical protein [Crassvirales sp.]
MFKLNIRYLIPKDCKFKPFCSKILILSKLFQLNFANTFNLIYLYRIYRVKVSI